MRFFFEDDGGVSEDLNCPPPKRSNSANARAFSALCLLACCAVSAADRPNFRMAADFKPCKTCPMLMVTLSSFLPVTPSLSLLSPPSAAQQGDYN